MAEFKCISCGYITENEEAYTCPVCGYKMFEEPYNRKNMLRKEIVYFISNLRLTKINDTLFTYYRIEENDSSSNNNEKEQHKVLKSEDDTRFPDFYKIRDYACAAKKTELFIERLYAVLEQIKRHLHTDFQQVYQTDFQEAIERIKGYDDILTYALKILRIDIHLKEIEFPEFTLDYSEKPNEELQPVTDAILSNLKELVNKIKKFVKLNNVYGTAYQYKSKRICKPSNEESQYIKGLIKTNEYIVSTNNKAYFVGIFSDGTEELREMLSVFWYGVSALLNTPVLNKTYRYQFKNGISVYKDKLESAFFDTVNVRYMALDEALKSTSFLADYSEDKLFDIYNDLIKLDKFGIIGLDESLLIFAGKSEKKLNNLIGLDSIKNSIKKIKAYAISNKDAEGLNLHMCFYGNPGTGKTEVARIIAGILYENKILPSNKVVEVDRSGLVGQYVGETPQKTMEKIEETMGGVLFIDEAYALVPKGGSFDYGNEAVATLIKAMEDYRGKFCVILAGYKNQMAEMIASNPGFKSRIQFELDFPDYSREELKQITQLMLKNRHYEMSDSALEKILDIADLKRKEWNFANARELRNILDQVIMCQNLRCISNNNNRLEIVDVDRYTEDSGIHLPASNNASKIKILTGSEELEQLIGLSSVKRMIKKIRAYAKKNKNDSNFNLHMCFYGNPGTGKTEVARILSRILYEAGILPEAKLLETDAHGLIGQYVGETAPKTLEKVQSAMGGVLFIDEAYALMMGTSQSSGDYGKEAVAALLKAMEDYRGKYCTVFAGYKNEMQTLLNSNPGLKSRIQFTLEFPDYTAEEFEEIAKLFLRKKKYEIESGALELIVKLVEYYRNQPNFANARTLRNILDQVIMNQNLRTEDDDENYSITVEDVEEYIADENIDLKNAGSQRGKIGFV